MTEDVSVYTTSASTGACLESLKLDYYHCTFFLPLDDIEKYQLKVKKKPYRWGSTEDKNQQETEYQALRFFSPVLRDLLFDTGDDAENFGLLPIREWRLEGDALGTVRIELRQEAFRCSARIVSLHLFRYFNGQYLLAYRVEPEAGESQPSLLLNDWLKFTNHARLLYSAFTEQEEEGKQSVQKLYINGELENLGFNQGSRMEKIHPNAAVSHVVRGLLDLFLDDHDGINDYFENCRNFYDDRMFVSVAYGLKNKLARDQLEQVASLAAWVDTVPENGAYVYDEATIKEMLHQNSFRLWQHKGGLYVFTDFANAYVYAGDTYFKNTIAPKHIPYEYDRMLIQALFYQASLRYYDRGIYRDTNGIINFGDLEKSRLWRSEFIRFTNQYWFHQLTEQMQGKAIFQLQQQALGLRQQYEIIKDELERTDEFLQMKHDLDMAHFSEKIELLGAVVALLALYYSLLPVFNEVYSINAEKSVITMWARVGSWLGFPPQMAESCGLLALVVGGGAMLAAIAWLGRWLWKRFKPQ